MKAFLSSTFVDTKTKRAGQRSSSTKKYEVQRKIITKIF